MAVPKRMDFDKLDNIVKSSKIVILFFRSVPEDEFPWHPYLPGFIRAKRKSPNSWPRLICVHSKKSVSEKQLNILGCMVDEVIEAEPRSVRDFLSRLYFDADYSDTFEPLNDMKSLNWDKVEQLAQAICEELNRAPLKLALEHPRYCNPFIRFHLARQQGSLEPDTTVTSSSRFMSELFSLGQRSVRWEQVENKLKQFERKWLKQANGLFREWVGELGAALEQIRMDSVPRQLRGRLVAANGRLYRAELCQWQKSACGRLSVVVTFSRQLSCEWLIKATKETALAYQLTIASRVRHDLAEQWLPRIRQGLLNDADWEDLDRLIDYINADGMFGFVLAQGRLEMAFEEEAVGEFDKIHTEYRDLIGLPLKKAIASRRLKETAALLERWAENNRGFLSIGLDSYKRLLGFHVPSVTSPPPLEPAPS